MALLALIVALSGTAYAATKIRADDIARNAVRAKHIKKENVKGKDLRCPGDLKRRAALCFETDARASAPWEEALADCEADGLRLPTVSEDYLALGTFPTPSGQENYWASDVYTTDSGGNTRIAFVAHLPAAGELAVGSAPEFMEQRYICVASAGA